MGAYFEIFKVQKYEETSCLVLIFSWKQIIIGSFSKDWAEIFNYFWILGILKQQKIRQIEGEISENQN